MLALVQQSMLGAVAVLRIKMHAVDSPPWLQVQCAKHLLDLGLRTVEIEQIEQRMQDLQHEMRELRDVHERLA